MPMTTQILVVMDAQNVIYLGSKKAIVDLASVKEQMAEEIAKLRKLGHTSTPTVVLSVDRVSTTNLSCAYSPQYKTPPRVFAWYISLMKPKNLNTCDKNVC